MAANPSGPTALRSQLEQALRLHQFGQLAAAARIYQQVLHRQPRQPDALNLLGVLRAQQGRHDEALALLRAAVSQRPKDGQINFNLARLLEQLGAEAEAVWHYRAAVAGGAPAASTLLNLGSLLLRQDRAGEAAECFAAAERAAPRDADAAIGHGLALLRLDDPTAARAAFERAIELAPGRPDAYGNLGSLLLRQGEVAAALAALERAVAAAPQQPELHVNLGIARHESGDPAAALAAYDTALTLAPGNARANGARVAALVALGRFAEAAALHDCNRLLRSITPPAPPGFAGLEAFHAALAEAVLSHPTLRYDRTSKTTRDGGQTGELLTEPAKPLRALRSLIADAVERYFADCAGDPAMAALVPRPPRWRITAWGTVLQAAGHQAPHNHPEGVVSGVYYVRLPPAEEAAAAPHAGWIEFGQPHAGFGCDSGALRRLYQPQAGQLLLFPSYFWHRTVPHAGPQPRISIAFDVIPQS